MSARQAKRPAARRVRVETLPDKADPHPALRATFSQWEKDTAYVLALFSLVVILRG